MSESGRGERWVPWIVAVFLAALLIAALVSYLAGTRGKDDRKDGADSGVEVTQRTACPHLEEALQALQDGDQESAAESLRAARKAALDALRDSSEEFGPSERLALLVAADYLNQDLDQAVLERTETRLEELQRVCEDLPV